MAISITGEEVVDHLLGYVQKEDNLAANAAFLGANAMTTSQQTQALRALVDEAHIAIPTENVTHRAPSRFSCGLLRSSAENEARRTAAGMDYLAQSSA